MSHPLTRALAAACLAAAVPAVAQAQQSATITGRVTNAAGQGLPAVSVFVAAQGQNFGTTTRADGTFTFSVPAARATGQATITARQVGYRAQSAQIALRGGTITQNFTLEAAPTTLAQVVVTGAGTVSTRERLGNVINSVDSTSLRRAVQPQNVVSALAGKAPNVEVRTQSGEPGASASIRIRGATSVTGTNEPLFVVDGQPIDNTTTSTLGGNQSTVAQNRASDINPNDIQSVEILKGAAAAAIYGARAANGVVLITTKSGRAGQTRYTLQSTTGFDRIYDKDILQRSFGQGIGTEPAVCEEVNCRFGLGGGAESWGPQLAGARTFNHVDEIFDVGNTLDNNLSVSGGSERTSFFLSGGQTRQAGVIVGPNNFYNRQSVRLKGTQQLNSRFTVGGNFNYVNTRGGYVQKGSNTSGLLLGALRTPPDFNNEQYLDSASGLHRSFRFPRPGSNSLRSSRNYDNPFFTLNNNNNRSELGRFIGNVNLDYRPVDWLRVQYTLGADNYSDDRREGLPLTSSEFAEGQVTRFTQNNLEVDHNLLATASREFNQNFSGTVTVGQNLNTRRFRSVLVTGQTLVAPEPLAIQNTLSYTPLEFRSTRNIEAYFGQATADLYNQLYLTAGLRSDGFSTFGASDRTALFPKGSVAWSFSRFAKPRLGLSADETGVWSFGKLRFAYGETGREPPVYATITALSTGSVANNEGFGSGYGDVINASQNGQGALVNGSQLGNTALRPERSVEREYGLDLGFFDQRATLAVTYFNKRSSDVILQVPVSSAETGSLTALRNAATIRNRGVEVELNGTVLKGRNYGLDVGVQFGRIRSRVLDLAGAQFVPYNTEGFTGAIGSSTVGYPAGVLRGSDFARCGRGLTIDLDGDNALENIDQLCGTGAAKDALFLGANGLPVLDVTDRVIADPNPNWTGGLNTQLRLGRFTLSGFLDVRRGGQVWNGTRGILYYFGTHRDTDIRTQTGGYGINWQTDVYPTVAGPGAGVAAFQSPAAWEDWLVNGEGSGFGNVGAQFVESASFAKLRELSVGYEADQAWVRRFGLSSVSARLAGRNLAMWTNYKGFDPEANLGGAEFLTQGIDYFNNPMTRSFVLSFTLNR